MLTSIVFHDDIDVIDQYAFSSYGKTIVKYANPDTRTAAALRAAGYAFRSQGDNFSLRYIDTDDGQTIVEITEVDKNAVTVRIPENVTRIADSAFYNCTALTGVNIPESVTEIGVCAFYGCSSLESLTIPSAVVSVGRGAFSYCTGLNHIFLPETLADIGTNAFAGCNVIIYADADSELAYALGRANYSFREPGMNYSLLYYRYYSNGEERYSTYLTSVDKDVISFETPERVEYIGSGAFADCVNLTSILIPDRIAYIPYGAFKNCRSLQRVVLPYSGFTSIGDQAFAGCTRLSQITIPDSVTSIGTEAFLNCTGLYHLSLKNQSVRIGTGAFSGCTQLTLAGYAGSTAQTYATQNNVPFTVLPAILQTGDCGAKAKWSLDENGLLRIYGSGPMYDYTSTPGYPKNKVTSLLVEEGITSIGKRAFNGFAKLTGSIQIAGTVTKIGEDAFSNTGITSFSFSSGVTEIGRMAFASCQNLRTVTLSASVQTIGDYAFYNCKELSSLNFAGHGVDIGKNAFELDTALSSGSTIIVPVGTTWYGSNTGYASFPSGITPVHAVFDGIWYRVVDKVFMGYGYGDYPYIDGPMMAVVGCEDSQTSIFIRSSVLNMPVKAIAEYAFTGGTDRRSAYAASKTITGVLVIPDSVEYIGYNVAYELEGITSLRLGSCVAYNGFTENRKKNSR